MSQLFAGWMPALGVNPPDDRKALPDLGMIPDGDLTKLCLATQEAGLLCSAIAFLARIIGGLMQQIGFMHVPKTGGNSLFKLILDHLPTLRVCPSPHWGVWQFEMTDQLAAYDFYSGHFDFDFFAQIRSNAVKLTIVRHPAARLVSLYDYWRGISPKEIEAITTDVPDNGPRFAAAVSFEEFIRNPTPFVRGHVENGFARQLLGRRYDELSPNSAAMMEKARARLEHFHWIGVAEHFSDSVTHLASMLDFELSGDVPWINDSYSGPERRSIMPTRPSRACLDYIERSNETDFHLYNLAAHKSFAERQHSE